MPLRQFALYTTSLLTMIIATSSFAAEPIANAGTLTCTLSPADKSPSKSRTEAPVTCNFVAMSGEDFDLSGRIMRLAAKTERSAKIVISWSVLAPTPGIAPKDLSGRFTGKIPNEESGNTDAKPTEGTLFGASRSGIELRPMDIDPATLPDAGLTVLELNIVSAKV